MIIQMKAAEQYFTVVLFIMLYRVLLFMFLQVHIKKMTNTMALPSLHSVVLNCQIIVSTLMDLVT